MSGGESQRIRLATQIGSGLVGVLYILDEPSIGLHQKDNEKLLEALRRLTDIGNTLIVVEHDEDTMYAADHIVDIGPEAGINGGELVAQGTVEDIINCPRSITGQYLSGKRKIEVPAKRRKGNGKKIEIIGASENNLKGIDVRIPLGEMVCVTGVSGSGKSSLINEILYKAVAEEMYGSKEKAGQVQEDQGNASTSIRSSTSTRLLSAGRRVPIRRRIPAYSHIFGICSRSFRKQSFEDTARVGSALT